MALGCVKNLPIFEPDIDVLGPSKVPVKRSLGENILFFMLCCWYQMTSEFVEGSDKCHL